MAAIETEVVFPRGRAVPPEILDRCREAQDQKRWKEEIRDREAEYLRALLKKDPNFLEPYRYFFPPKAMEATLEYYFSQATSPPPENLHLVRRLIYLTIKQRSKDLPPLPAGTFLVTEKEAEQFKNFWQNSPLSFFSGKVSEDFPPQRRFVGINYQEYLGERQELFDIYRQKDPRLERLKRIRPQIIYSLEGYYFQGKLLDQIGQELQLGSRQVSFYKDLGLTALGIKEPEGRHGSRCKLWLEPVLRRWGENEDFIKTLPPTLQKIAWLILEGRNAQSLSQEFGTSYKATQALREQLLGRIPRHEGFKDLKRSFVIKNLFSLSFDQQPITQLTLAVLKAKAQGLDDRKIEKTLGVEGYQTTYLLRGVFEDLGWAFPSLTLPPATKGGSLRFKQGVWQNLSRRYHQLTQEMVRSGCHLTPRQEKFLQGALEANFTPTPVKLLNLYLERIKPRKKKREAITNLAQDIQRKHLSAFPPSEMEIISAIAQGRPLHRIFPKGGKDRQFRRLLEQMRAIVQTSKPGS